LGFAVDNGKTTATRVADPPAARKRNAVAHETAVTVAGARPGESAGRRELFTENTTSVLVFENGGVIRLGTDVIVGQLLFLTHRESKQEVVAQVTGKQRFHAGSPYIEMEFTEATPGFWGVEFPAKPLPEGAVTPARPAATRTLDLAPTPAPARAPDLAPNLVLTPAQTPEQTGALTPPAATDSEAPAAADAELMYVLEEAVEEPGEAPAARSAEEVERLRQEVETLRVQLQSLKQAVGAEGNSTRGDGGGRGKAAEVPARSNGTRNELLDVNAPSEAPSTPPVRAEEHGEEPTQPATKREFAAQDLLPAVALDFSRADEAIERSVKAERKSERKGALKTGKAGGGKTLTVALLAAVLLAAATGVAWYKHWLPQLGRAKASPSSAARPAPVAPADGPKASVTPADANGAAGTSQTTAAETVAGGKDAPSVVPATDAAAGAEAAAEPKTYRDPTRLTIPEKAGNSRIVAGRGNTRAANKLEAAEVAVAPEGGATVPPKLLQSVRAMPPPEAVRGFVTGNVNLDAVVDASGHVSSMKVLSGPAALRNAAMDALKQYRYEPARQNGRAVSAHVNVTVQFWYEP